ncbi:MAG: aromatic ring-hydroxylating dioxygenase subunit alpha [Nostocales cyanobacterium]|nr:MAG: aromatic ring-hydroxylating dioxygenase subunit alpha [Nostocales cyanobacterium]
MTIIANTQITPDQEKEFDWKNCWYPVTFLQDLTPEKLYSFSIYDQPLVLFKNQNGEFGCVKDFCPHRAAKLSDGKIIDGKIECPYHGWQFNQDGKCLHIPQLPKDAKIPHNACIQSYQVVEKQGIIWVWLGDKSQHQEASIPTLSDLEDDQFVTIDFMYERPYDQSYFIENVIDPAHIPISHDGSDGKRENAQPLEFRIIESSLKIIRSQYRNTREDNAIWINLDIVTPNLVLYRICDFPKPGLITGLALYSIPTHRGKCRVLSRYYRNYETWKIKLQPRWFSHFYRIRVVEEDIQVTQGVQSQIERANKNLNELYLPLKSSDTLSIEYRKWLDKYGASLPFYQGYTTSKLTNCDLQSQEIYNHSLARFERHTKICSSCYQAYQTTKLAKKGFIFIGIILAAIAIITDNSPISNIAVFTSLLSFGLAFAAEKLKLKFERPYIRS